MLLLNLSTPNLLPTLDVQVLFATRTPDARLADKALNTRELSQVFAKQNLNHFYALDDVTISFDGRTPEAPRIVSLPQDRSARFAYSGRTAEHHVLEFSLPEYNVTTQLQVPESKTFYQAGIKHGSGMIILKMRLNPLKK